LYKKVKLKEYISMFSDELKKLLLEVISSWQVWAVTVVLVIFISLVNYTSKVRGHRPPPKPKQKKVKPEPVAAPAVTASDDLGIEEDTSEE
jgi:hypothetical protein